MRSPCRVKLTATSKDQFDVHIEDAGDPGRLLYVQEDERHGAVPPVRRACGFLRARRICRIDLRLDPDLSYTQRNDIFEGLRLLLRLEAPPAKPAAFAVLYARKVLCLSERSLSWWMECGIAAGFKAAV